MTKRERYSSGTNWEALAGYSRAMRAGDWVHVAGTTATDENGALVGGDDPYSQAIFIFGKIERALRALGAELADVVRTRVYVVQQPHWEAVARAHGEVFGDIRPVNTLIVIDALVGDEYLVEIEATAYTGDRDRADGA